MVRTWRMGRRAGRYGGGERARALQDQVRSGAGGEPSSARGTPRGRGQRQRFNSPTATQPQAVRVDRGQATSLGWGKAAPSTATASCARRAPPLHSIPLTFPVGKPQQFNTERAPRYGAWPGFSKPLSTAGRRLLHVIRLCGIRREGLRTRFVVRLLTGRRIRGRAGNRRFPSRPRFAEPQLAVPLPPEGAFVMLAAAICSKGKETLWRVCHAEVGPVESNAKLGAAGVG